MTIPELYASGLSISQIERIRPESWSTIRRIIIRAGVSLRPKHYTNPPIADEAVLVLARAGLPDKSVAHSLRCCTDKVYRVRKSHGLMRRADKVRR